MNRDHIRTDSFFVKKHKLRIYRIAERGSAVLLWTSVQQAARYVQKLQIQKLLAKKKGQ